MNPGQSVPFGYGIYARPSKKYPKMVKFGKLEPPHFDQSTSEVLKTSEVDWSIFRGMSK